MLMIANDNNYFIYTDKYFIYVLIIILTLSMLSKKFSRRHLEILSFFQETGFDISYKFSPEETICMKCQIIFSGYKICRLQNLLIDMLTTCIHTMCYWV